MHFGYLTLAASFLTITMVSGWFPLNSATDIPKSVVKVDCIETIRANGAIATGHGKRDRAVFHLRGSPTPGGPSARFVFRDNTSGVSLRSDNLVSYETVDADTRRLTFAALYHTTNRTIVVVVRDLDRRGKTDVFELMAPDFTAAGRLSGGQIKFNYRGPACAESQR